MGLALNVENMLSIFLGSILILSNAAGFTTDLSGAECLPRANCQHFEQPLCSTCIHGDANCIEPDTLTDGFCGPYIDYTENDEITRRERYAACKDAALARATPEQREILSSFKHRYFYKNCIGGEYMCHDGSCWMKPETCNERGGVKYLASNHSFCTSKSKKSISVSIETATKKCFPMEIIEFEQHQNIITIAAKISNDEEIQKPIEIQPVPLALKETNVVSYPRKLTTNQLVRFCTYFYEVVVLGGLKEPAATERYVRFLYNCFEDYQDFGSRSLMDSMNMFFTLSGEKAINNLNDFDATGFTTPEIIAANELSENLLVSRNLGDNCQDYFQFKFDKLVRTSNSSSFSVKKRIVAAKTSDLSFNMEAHSLENIKSFSVLYCRCSKKNSIEYASLKEFRNISLEF